MSAIDFAEWQATLLTRTLEEQAEDERRDAEWKAKIAAADRRAHRLRLLEAGIPDRVVDTLLSGDFEENSATKVVRQFMASEETFLLLAGLPGTGKTFAAYLALLLWSADRKPGRVYKAGEIARCSLYEGKGLALDTIKNTKGVLVIDDLGAEFVSEKGAAIAIFEELIDHRYEHGDGTVITTNLNSRDLLTRYGERIMQRVSHLGTAIELPRQSKNYRGGK